MKAHALLLMALLAPMNAGADEATNSYYEPAAFFRIQILPILQKRCFECHSKEHEIEGGLALDSKTGWMTGGDHGPAVTPNNLKKSPLIQAIRHHNSDSAMPPEEKLPPIEIALLETWVLLGAPDPRTDNPASKTGPK
ncbi:c-type cytochrome domain-containing protein [Prosthecobacter sp.]|uniref:c-type cytochrome domain-containing protein n=1 Tax=Prosthecobacter sp. TaxID=1965333 RepID=UPI001D971630|nr:c-type cytochrome domain-containing protein [Prosthecobacter sp.]MCB1278898.1 hypothetical protein [Prosthecobacter sp.]